MKEIYLLITRTIYKLGFGPQIYSIYSQLYYDKPDKPDYRMYI